MKERKLTVEDIINIYGEAVKEVKVFNKKQRVQQETFLQDEPKAFALSDEPDVLRIYMDIESCEASFDGTLEAKEIAQDIVDAVGKDVAAGLVEYANLVKQLAEDLTDEQLEDSAHIKSLLKEQLPAWDREDWYDLLKAVRKEKHKEQHEQQTAEVIFNQMPYFAQAAAQQAVDYIVKAAKNNNLFHADKVVDQAEETIREMFFCMGIDIKDAAVNLSKKNFYLTGYDWQDNKYLLAYIEELRAKQWESGEVAQLRTKELR